MIDTRTTPYAALTLRLTLGALAAEVLELSGNRDAEERILDRRVDERGIVADFLKKVSGTVCRLGHKLSSSCLGRLWRRWRLKNRRNRIMFN